MSADSAQPPRIPQLHALTGIRGIAAWFVVLYHMRASMELLLPDATLAFLGKGYLAVDLFFMLSGFVMWLNYGTRLRQQGMAGVPRFWWKRFARIWPLHGFILLTLVAFAILLLATGRDTSNYPFAELPLHVLLMQNWGFVESLRWNHPAWSISAEMGAYLLFPFIVLLLPWDRFKLPALGAALALLCTALFALFALNGHTLLGDDIAGLGLWRCVAEFALGMVLCRIWQLVPHGGHDASGPALLLVAGLLLAGCVAAGVPEIAFLPLVFAIFLLGLALDCGRISAVLGSAPLRALGDASYATYLVHYPLFIWFKIAFADEQAQIGWGGVIGFLALLLACSFALYRWLEKPAQGWLNSRSPAVRGRAVPSA